MIDRPLKRFTITRVQYVVNSLLFVSPTCISHLCTYKHFIGSINLAAVKDCSYLENYICTHDFAVHRWSIFVMNKEA